MRCPSAIFVALVACSGAEKPTESPGSDGQDNPGTDTDTDTDSGADSGVPGPIPEPGPPCAAPVDEPAYVESDPSGVLAQVISELNHTAQGVAVADLDSDGRLDLILPEMERVVILMNDGELGWRDETEERLGELGRMRLVSPVDLDGDGAPELSFHSREDGMRLFQNDGTGHFTRLRDRGMGGLVNHKLRALAWADQDGDGDLDVWMSSDGTNSFDPTDRRFLQTGPMEFTESTDELPEASARGYAKGAVLLDLDMDGHTDVLTYHHLADVGGGNVMLAGGADGALVAVADNGLDVTMSAMGAAVADLNGDLRPDIALSDFEPPELFLSLDDKTWFMGGAAANIFTDEDRDQIASWGIVLDDLDLDGDLDLASVFGPTDDPEEIEELGRVNPMEQPDEIWAQDADGKYTPVGEAWGFSSVDVGRGLATADFDGDGMLEIITAGQAAPVRVFRSPCTAGEWLQVDLHGLPENRQGIGARVSVEAGGKTHTRWVMAGGLSHMTSQPTRLHFGLGTVDRVDVIRVRFPDGTEVEDREAGLRTVHTVVHPEAAR